MAMAPRRGESAAGRFGLALGVASALAAAVSNEHRAEAGDGDRQGSGVQGSPPLHLVVPALEQVESMCALLTSCDHVAIPPALFAAGFPACVDRMAAALASSSAVEFSRTMLECGLGASSCGELRRCALRGASPEACRGRGRRAVTGLCDLDGRALSCWHDEVIAVRDCTRGDEQCAVSGGVAACTLGRCPRSMQEGDVRCSASGKYVLRCEHGVLHSLDCAAFGLACSAEGRAARCAGGGPSCDDERPARCEGDRAVGCFHGHEVIVDCAAAGLACAAPRPGAVAVGACVAAEPDAGACDRHEPPRCEGDAIRYCRAGRSRSLSCTALGLHGCTGAGSGVRCGN